MMNKVQELSQILQNNFGLTISDGELDTESAYLEHLKLKLSERIKFFIRTDLDKLLQALYRIDVDDSLSNQAFNLGEINLVSNKLAELIILRQLKKIEYSREFNKK
jgi:hypothetical protein